MTQRSISNTRGRCSTQWRDSALHHRRYAPLARSWSNTWSPGSLHVGAAGSRSPTLTARCAAFSASPFARWAGRFQPRLIIRRLASTESGCLCWQWCRDPVSGRLCQRHAAIWTVIEIFEMRDRTKVRCDDEIAGEKRAVDQLTASWFFNGELSTASIRTARDTPSATAAPVP